MNFSISALETVELRTPAASFFFMLLKKPFFLQKRTCFYFSAHDPRVAGKLPFRLISGIFVLHLLCATLH